MIKINIDITVKALNDMKIFIKTINIFYDIFSN
jgi:hypothetical protein